MPRVKNRRAALLTVILDHNVALRQFGGKIKKKKKKSSAVNTMVSARKKA